MVLFYWLRKKLYEVLGKVRFLAKQVHYIGGSETLPPPLNREEEMQLIEKLAGSA